MAEIQFAVSRKRANAYLLIIACLNVPVTVSFNAHAELHRKRMQGRYVVTIRQNLIDKLF